MTDCRFCGGKKIPKTVDVQRKWQGKLVIITNVPAYVCEQCGEQYFDAEVALEMDRIKSEFGQIPLSKLNPIHIQNLYVKKLREGRADGKGGGLSARMVRYMHSLLSEALHYAVANKLISENPPKSVKPVRVAQKEMACLTPEQVRVFLEAAKSDRFYPLFL